MQTITVTTDVEIDLSEALADVDPADLAQAIKANYDEKEIIALIEELEASTNALSLLEEFARMYKQPGNRAETFAWFTHALRQEGFL